MLAVLGALLLLTTTQSAAFEAEYTPYEGNECLTIEKVALDIDKQIDSDIVDFDDNLRLANGKTVRSVTLYSAGQPTLLRIDFDQETNCFVGAQQLTTVEFSLLKTGV